MLFRFCTPVDLEGRGHSLLRPRPQQPAELLAPELLGGRCRRPDKARQGWDSIGKPQGGNGVGGGALGVQARIGGGVTYILLVGGKQANFIFLTFGLSKVPDSHFLPPQRLHLIF